MKTIWIIANWKSNKTIAEALDWIAQAGPQIPKNDRLKAVVCPSFSALSEVKKAISVGSYAISVGTQDLSPFSKGAYTGEEPAVLLSQLISLAILGHSERRQNFKETDDQVAHKTVQALQNNITPLVCVQNQDTPVPDNCKLVAYEPIFAIGTGNADTAENADEVAEILKDKHPGIEVLYGGSVTAENVRSFIAKPNISGILLGKASLSAEEFVKICKIGLECI